MVVIAPYAFKRCSNWGLKFVILASLWQLALLYWASIEVHMRFKKSFILRLYIDTAVPDLLCGDLQIPSSQEKFSFKSEVALIILLHQLGALPVIDNPPNQKETNS